MVKIVLTCLKIYENLHYKINIVGCLSYNEERLFVESKCMSSMKIYLKWFFLVLNRGLYIKYVKSWQVVQNV